MAQKLQALQEKGAHTFFKTPTMKGNNMKRNFIRIISMFLLMLFLSMTYQLKDASAACTYCDRALIPLKIRNIDVIRSLNDRAKVKLIVGLIEVVESKDADTKVIDAILKSAIQGNQVEDKDYDRERQFLMASFM